MKKKYLFLCLIILLILVNCTIILKCNNKVKEIVDINKLLNEPEKGYKEYRNKVIKVNGKVSKIIGTNSIWLQEYNDIQKGLNGHVIFNNTSKLIIELNGIDISDYKIYDYITIEGLIYFYNKKDNTIYMKDIKIEEHNLYDEYNIEVVESNNCKKTEYIDSYYLYCLENIYVDYKVDKYELSYALKDKKILIEDLYKNSEVNIVNNIKVFKHKNFNIMLCNENNNIIINKREEIDYSLCE